MKSLMQLCKLELKLSVRNVMYFFFTILFPVLLILLFGGLYGNEPNEAYGGYGAIDASLPAYIAMTIATAGLTGIAISITTYKEQKVLKRYQASPISKAKILLPIFIANLFMLLCGTFLLIIIGIFVFKAQFSDNLLLLIAYFIVSVISTFSLGLFLSCICKTTKQANSAAFLLYFPMIFLSGATMPIDTFPDFMKKIANFVPLRHCVVLLQGAWFDKPFSDIYISLIVLVALSIVFIGLSLKFFKWE